MFAERQEHYGVYRKPVHNSLVTNDIEGAQPGKRYGSRQSRKLSGAGQRIVDNTTMVAAGVKGAPKMAAKPGNLSDIFSLGGNESYVSK